jgi:hypothetical protein
MTEINSGNPDFDAMLKSIADLHHRKNSDYGNPAQQDYYANFRESLELGIPMEKGILVRMSDKWSRLKHLQHRPPEVANESIEDTAIDLAVYSLLYVLVRRLTTCQNGTATSAKVADAKVVKSHTES